jgi:SAM-dependent methyltransferase
MSNNGSCRVCGNIEKNKYHEFREMLFGTRDRFQYLECGSCSTIHLTQEVDLAKYYPQDYYSFEAIPDISSRSRARRFVTSSVTQYLLAGKNVLGRVVSHWRPDIERFFPASLRDRRLRLNLDSNILDVGSGMGHLLVGLRYFGFRNLSGVDLFVEHDITIDGNIMIRKCEIDELDEKFDLIMFHHSLEHMPDPVRALTSAFGLLRAGGYCLVRIPIVSWAWKEYGEHWVALDPPRHLFLFTVDSFSKVAKDVGFVVDAVKHDSTMYQFWASTQIKNDIRVVDGIRGGMPYLKQIFGEEQLGIWTKTAEELNSKGMGDTACFYLRRS